MKEQSVLRPSAWLAARKLKASLVSYPIYRPPHLRSEIDLTASKAKENFEYFLQQRSFRLQSFRDFMKRFNIDVATTDASLTDVSHWFDHYGGLLLNFRPYSSIALRAFLHYDPPWTGTHIGINAVWDLAIYLGECVIARRPSAHWALNTGNPDPISREAIGFQRP